MILVPLLGLERVLIRVPLEARAPPPDLPYWALCLPVR